MHIIFDLYGTLYQPGLSVMSVLKQISDRLGLPYPDEAEVYQLVHQDVDTYLKALYPQVEDLGALKALFLAYEKQHAEGGDLFPGTKELLQTLRQAGHTLSVCSTGNDNFMQTVLQQNGIGDFFAHVKSARPYRSKGTAISTILQTGESAVLIGDTLIDFQAARENHIPSIGVSYGFGALDDFSAATFRAGNMQEILTWLNHVEIFGKITQHWLGKTKARILGINGVDTSGKTTFARNYQRYLRAIGLSAEVISLDNFHNPKTLRTTGPNEIEAYEQNAFDTEKLIREILQPIKVHGKCVKEISCLNLATDSYDKKLKVEINSDTLVILEGVLLFKPPLNAWLDERVFLDISFEEVLRRAEKRDVPLYGPTFLERYRTKYIPIQQRYLEQHHPKQKADFIIDNNNFLMR
jgi:phosphoglycolate phosphatase